MHFNLAQLCKQTEAHAHRFQFSCEDLFVSCGLGSIQDLHMQQPPPLLACQMVG